MRGWFGRHPLAGDGLLALTLLLVTAGAWQINTTTAVPGFAPMDRWSVLWLIAGSVPVLVRRYRLWWSVALTIAILIASVFDPIIAVSVGFSSLVVLYTIAAHQPIRPALALTAVLWVSLTATSFFPSDFDFTNTQLVIGLLYSYIMLSIAFGIGRAVHNRRRNLVELHERARLAEENQVALATQAVADERRRIARELHDVVAHHISVMGVMATGARRMLTKDPAKADEALATIETTGRSTLREMRRLLDVLRSNEENDDTDDDLTPQPGLDAVHALIGQVRDAGLAVNLVINGEPYGTDPGIALTVFRIVQECLTNTLKHAGPARAGVRITYGETGLELEISDNGTGPKSLHTGSSRVGHGLVGMRERVALYGGTLRTGPRPGGGFRVHAVIPIDSPAAVGDATPGGNR